MQVSGVSFKLSTSLFQFLPLLFFPSQAFWWGWRHSKLHRRPTVIQGILYKAEKIKLFKQISPLVIQPYNLAAVHYSVRIYTSRWLPYLVIKTYLHNVPLPRLTFKLPSPLHCNKQLAQSRSLPTPTAHRHSISDAEHMVPLLQLHRPSPAVLTSPKSASTLHSEELTQTEYQIPH